MAFRTAWVYFDSHEIRAMWLITIQKECEQIPQIKICHEI